MNVVELKEGYSYHYEMPDDMFYFYHVAHMAKHFENGGCGIRPFIDLWILDNMQINGHDKRDNLLRKGKLLQFANSSRKLSQVWVEGYPIDKISEKMQNYIIRGGVYGTSENRITVQQLKKGGKLRYALSRIIIPYEDIKYYYPILQKHKWLTPVMQIRRWFNLAFFGGVKRSVRELSCNSNIPKSQVDEMKVFLVEIGL